MAKMFLSAQTSGLIDFDLPVDDFRQPRIVQLGYIISDDDGSMLVEHSEILTPLLNSNDPAGISSGAYRVHRIAGAFARANGDTQEAGIRRIYDIMLRYGVTEIISHNIRYHAAALRGGFKRAGLAIPKFKEFCTMREGEDIVCERPTTAMIDAEVEGFKPPTLREAYLHFVGETPYSTGNFALSQCRAIYAVWLGIQKHKAAEKEALLKGEKDTFPADIIDDEIGF